MTNRALREWHEVLATKVVDLMRTSLVRSKDRCDQDGDLICGPHLAVSTLCTPLPLR